MAEEVDLSTGVDASLSMSSVLRCTEKQACSETAEISVPIALNFGGLLIKVVYYAGGELHLRAFGTDQLSECAEHLSKLIAEHRNVRFCIPSTNREANLYILRSMLHIEAGDVEFYDELDSSHRGLVFLLERVSESAFTFETEEKKKQSEFSMMPKPGRFVPLTSGGESQYPLIALQVDDFVTGLRIEGVGKYTVMGRSEFGGAAFCGLGNQLTGARSFDELLASAATGDHGRVDMLVEDIYGSAYASVGLPRDLIASSFGKARRCVTSGKESTGAPSTSVCTQGDAAKSLVVMYAAYLAQLASLYAAFPADAQKDDDGQQQREVRQTRVKRIIFAGSSVQMRKELAYAFSEMLHFWTGARYDAVFLRLEAFVAPLGHLVDTYRLLDNSCSQWLNFPEAQ